MLADVKAIMLMQTTDQKRRDAMLHMSMIKFFDSISTKVGIKPISFAIYY